jgi:hypothetical protein
MAENRCRIFFVGSGARARSKGSTQMASLRERFESFVKTLDGFEDIDALLKNCDLPSRKQADYLFAERKFIVEQKALEVDPIEKPQKFMDQLMAQGRFIAYGRVSTKAIFDKLSDGEELQRQLVLKLTKVLDGILSHADKQTRDTREIFSIQNAVGVVVILNEKVSTLSPDVIHYGLSYVFRKISGDGSLRYPHNNGVILISEAHIADIPHPGKVFPILVFTSPHGRGKADVGHFSSMLMERWAKFNGVPLLLGSPTKFRAL